MGKNKNFKREERKIGGGGWADQFAALGYTTTVDKDENKVEIPENAFINPYTFIPIGAKEPNRKTLKEALEGEKLYDGYLDCSCTLSEYLSQSRFKMRLERNEWDKTGKAEITRDRANLTETILRVCDSNNEKNGQNFISVFAVMKNKRIIG